MIKKNRKIFGVLFFSIFGSVTGVGIVVPLLPVYAKSLGASGFYIGMIFGAFSLPRIAALPYFGRLSDKKGRKPFIVNGLLAYSLFSVIFFFAESVWGLSAARFLQGVASAAMAPAIQAYVADIAPEGSEGKIMGAFHMSMFLGLSAGPVAGGMISDYFSMNAAFLCMAVLSFTGFLLNFLLLPPLRVERSFRQIKKKNIAPWKKIVCDRTIIGIFIFRLSYTSCIGVIWGFLPIFADSEFSLSGSSIGTLVMLGVFINGMLNLPMGYLADRFDKKIMIISGGLLASYAVYSLSGSENFRDMLVANILFGLGGGLATPAIMAMAAIAGKKEKAAGSVMAIMTMAHSVGMMTGGFAAGIIMDAFLLRHVFSLAAIVMLAGLAAFIFFAGFAKMTENQV